MFKLLGGGYLVDCSLEPGDQGVCPEPFKDCRVPVVGTDQQVAVALQVRGHAAHRLLQPQILRQVISEGRETGPDTHGARVAACLLGRTLHRRHNPRSRFIGEECM